MKNEQNKTPLPTASQTPRKTSGWSRARCRKHAASIRHWKPWAKSTGPKTASGKATSSRNALKHGHRSAAMTRYLRLLKNHSALLSNLRKTVAVTRTYRRYAARNCALILQKLIIAKGLDGHKKMGTNELLNIALKLRLIRFPKRAKAKPA